MVLDAWHTLREALVKIEREVDGCGPDCSKDFLRLALVSVRDMARGALGKAESQK